MQGNVQTGCWQGNTLEDMVWEGVYQNKKKAEVTHAGNPQELEIETEPRTEYGHAKTTYGRNA